MPTPNPLDAMAKKYLGVKDDKDVEIVKGTPLTKDRATKIEEAQQRALMRESCLFSEALIKFFLRFKELSFKQKAWGFMLGLYCNRGEYPVGVETFDDIVEMASNDLKLEVTTPEIPPEEQKPELAMLTEEEQLAAAVFSEQFAKFIERTKQAMGLSNPQGVYGLGRAFHNLRLTYPADAGGTEAFDALAQAAALYYQGK